jgi:membrane protease YdiL (CAAX protease family)
MPPMASKAKPKRIRKNASATAAPIDSSYWQATREPTACLIFLVPMIAAYEMGALMLRPEVWPERRLVAQRLIQQLVAWFGTDAVWVPGVALVITLVIWQLVSQAPWKLRGWVPLAMIAESLVLTIPLFVLGRLVLQATNGAFGHQMRVQIVLALGAGIYEELVFRFYLVTGLIALFTKSFKIPPQTATVSAIAAGGALFALCHFRPIGSEPFAWPMFFMFAAAGGYLATVFVLRGLGVSTGCHAAFNLITLLLAEQ